MTNPRILAILRQCVEEEKQDRLNEKLILIQDIIRAKKTLWAFGYTQHNEFLTDSAAGKLFDYLYDCTIEVLEDKNSELEREINSHLAAKTQPI
ncbi:MAG: hypothetical protein WC055_01960 [Melioribacteraceae bacterium]